MRRDDSSIDSLEVSPPPRKDQISLSRDSGLTLSDSQLYTPDEEESGSTSSSGYDPAFDQAHHSAATTKSSSTTTATVATPPTAAATLSSMPGEYVRVYAGWEDRKNVNFQRQAWFRQRSKRLSGAASKEAVRRSASEESVLDGNVPPPTPPRRSKPAAVLLQPCNNRTSLPPVPHPQQQQQQHQDLQQYHRKISSDYYNVQAVNKSEVVVESLHPNNYNTELTIKPVATKEDQLLQQVAPPARRTVQTGEVVVDCGGSRRYSNNVQADSCKEEDSSTLSDEDCTPHVSRSNSRGNEVAADSLKLRQHQLQSSPTTTSPTAPPVHVDGTVRLRGRLKRKEEKAAVAAARSRSLPPPPPYRPPPPATNRRAPITSYYLGECSQAQQQRFVVTRTYADEESYV